MKLPNAQLAVVDQAKICGPDRPPFDHRSPFGGEPVIHEHDSVVLTQDIPDEGLQAGDVGTVVHIHQGAAAYEVEFMTLTGLTITVATALASQLRPVSSRDVSHVRELAPVQAF
jgi:hypothetical protein